MKTNNFVTLFTRLEDYHISKDVCQVPFHMYKEFGYDSYIIGHNKFSKNKTSIVEGLNFFDIPKMSFLKISISSIFFLIANAKQIKILNLFHIRIYNLIYVYIYKLFNKEGIVYIKGDLSAKDLKINKLLEVNIFKKIIGRFLLKNIGQKIDILSAETKEAKIILQNEYSTIFKKIILIPNGVDSNFVENNIEKRFSFEEKDNMLLTVGRIGATEKNNEIMLKVLSKIELFNWKVYFIGPIENNFQVKVENFYIENPLKKNSVIFLGSLNKKELYKFYNKSKVFFLTSNYEGFPLVFPEALYFGNYIVSTDISSAEDVIEYNNGELINENNLSNVLNKIVSTGFLSNAHIVNSRKLSKDKFLWKNIIKELNRELPS